MSLVPNDKTAAIATQSDMPEQVFALYQQALAKGPEGVGALEKLIDLQDRIQRRNAELQFSRSLAEFQASCPPVQRSSEAKVATRSGSSYSFTYADLEEIISTVRPHLSAHGFSFSFDSETDGKMLRCVCTLRHEMGHRETASFKVTTESASGASEQQKVGGALTYAKRMCLISVLGLSLTDPDPDAQAAANVARITDEQALNLVALLEETNVKPSQFCARFKIESVGDLPAPLYKEAVRALESRRKAAAQ